jgi:rare lipoprotein A
MSTPHAFVRILTFVAGVLTVVGCSEFNRRRVYRPNPTAAPVVQLPNTSTVTPAQRGVASYYAPAFHGRRTANGERFDTQALTAAHNTLPFGTIVRVVNVANGRSVEVRVNDRGPFVGGRVIDVSARAAEALGMVDAGIADVRIYVLRPAAFPALASARR